MTATSWPIAAIRNAHGSVAGMGVLIGDRHVLSCAHVVNLALGRNQAAPDQPAEAVRVFFPLAARTPPVAARVVRWCPVSDAPGPEDIAVLRLETAPPAGVTPAAFADPAVDQRVRAYGYPRGSRFGNWHDGRVLGRLENGWYQIDDDSSIGVFLQPGFSGTPLWDAARGCALGIVVAAETGEDRKGVGYMIPAAVLREVWEDLRQAEPIEEIVLARYCQQRVAAWDAARADPDDPDKLQHYVEPHYSLLREGRPMDASCRPPREAKSPDETAQEPYEPLPGREAGSLAELTALLASSRRLCVTEDAGTGKSIFTRRLQAFLSRPAGQQAVLDGRPHLVVRWEHRVHRWPRRFDRDGLIDELAKELAPCIETLGVLTDVREVAAWALRTGRVVLILDALDQVTDAEAITSLEESLHSGPARPCRVVLTSRAYAAADHWPLFQETGGWQFARIDGFDRQQQAEYLRQTPAENVEAFFPEYEQVEPLLRIPVVLSMVRELCAAGELTSFRTRGELYLQVHEHLTTRAARRLGLAPDAVQRVRWREILAATACEMMVRGCYNYAVQGDDAVCDVRDGASARCGVPIAADEWRVIEAVSDLTDRCILEGASRENLCWKHRGMMEFYCGMHLARNTQPGWIGPWPPSARRGAEPSDSPRATFPLCADPRVAANANQQQWYWSWRFAAEMSPAVWQGKPDTLLASLAALFQPPASGRRPCELMYRAWSVLEGQPSGRLVLEAFRGEFRRLLEARDGLALTLVPEEELVAAGLLSEQEAKRRRPEDRNFVRCPPAGLDIDNQPFWMGTSDKAKAKVTYSWGEQDAFYADERPRHRVTVSPAWAQATPVTRAQYRLFDAHHEQEDTWWIEYAPQQDCPVVDVDWYDAWVFAHWLGGRLPTEAEWEYACRAGKDGVRDYFHVGESLTSHQANFNGEYPFPSGAEKGPYLGKSSPVRSYPANAWGLYDMHGNVWEWCQDWFDADYYKLLAESAKQQGVQAVEDPQGPDAGSSRVLRGGSWRRNSDDCRSACRNGPPPGAQGSGVGFRVWWACCGLRPSRPLG